MYKVREGVEGGRGEREREREREWERERERRGKIESEREGDNYICLQSCNNPKSLTNPSFLDTHLDSASTS